MGTQATLPNRGQSPQFSAHVYCGQTAAWIDATWYGGRPRPRRHCVRWGPSPSPKAGRASASPIFDPLLLWPDGWMHQAATWYGVRPQPRGLCVRWGPSPSPKAGQPQFLAHLLWPNGWMHQDATWYGGRPGPSRLCSTGTQLASEERAHPPPPNFWPMSIMSKRLNGSRYAAWCGGKPQPRRHCVRWGCSSPLQRAQPPVFGSCLAGWMKTPLGTEVDLGPLHIVLGGVLAPGIIGTAAPPLFSADVYYGHSRPSQLLLSSCLFYCEVRIGSQLDWKFCIFLEFAVN